MCCTSFRVSLTRSISNLSHGVQAKEIIKDMKNLPMKAMCACVKEVTERAYFDQRIKERLDAGIIPKIAPDTCEIVHPAKP